MVQLLEPFPVKDVYSDGIATVDNLGCCFRTTYFVWSPHGDRLAVAKLIRPKTCLIGRSAILAMLQTQPELGDAVPWRLLGSH